MNELGNGFAQRRLNPLRQGQATHRATLTTARKFDVGRLTHFVQRHEISASTVRGNRGVDLLVEHHEGHRGQGTVDPEGQNILRYTGVDLFGRGAVGIDEHQTPTTFARELETTPAQTVHAGAGHDNGDLAVASDRGVTRGQVQLGEVEI